MPLALPVLLPELGMLDEPELGAVEEPALLEPEPIELEAPELDGLVLRALSCCIWPQAPSATTHAKGNIHLTISSS